MKIGTLSDRSPIIDGHSLPTAEQAPSTRASPADSASFRDVFNRLAGEVDRGERVVKCALNGGASNDTRSMIALQAGVYRYVEAVDLCTRLIDRAAGAVKTTLQSQ